MKRKLKKKLTQIEATNSSILYALRSIEQKMKIIEAIVNPSIAGATGPNWLTDIANCINPPGQTIENYKKFKNEQNES